MKILQMIFWSTTIILASFYFGYYGLCKYITRFKDLNVKKNKKFRPKISFVIPTWNEENSIEGKIKNTLKLSYPKNKLEIIVIDSGSKDNTRKIVRRFKNVKLITEKERSGKASSLNKSFKHCNGEIVVISDADCRLKKDILLKSMPYFNDPSVGAVTGRESIINFDENTATRIEKKYRDFFYLIRGAESILDSTYVFDGPFSAFRRELLDEIDNTCVADDSELAMKVKKKGYRVLSIPEAIYFEYAPSNLSDRDKQKSRRAEGLTQSMFRYFRTFFLNKKYGLFGLVIFPAGIFMHIISPFLLILMLVTVFTLSWKVILLLIIISLLAFAIPKLRFFILTFLYSQLACLKGIINHLTKKPNYNWEKIQCTRRYRDGNK